MNVEKLRSSSAWLAARDRFYETLDGETCVREISQLIERQVVEVFEGSSRDLLSPGEAPLRIALFACGGFGRGEVFPHSDVDLVFVHPPDASADALKRIVRPVTQTLWDLGLEPSHSVRSLHEIARFQADNTELYLSLLDARPLAGDSALLADFEKARHQLLREKRDRIASRLFDLIDGRWHTFQHTIHHLEPDLKDGPGGLRDLHSLRWLARLKNEVPFWSENGRWNLFEREAMRHFAAIRCFLHYEEQRNQNILRFDPQEEWLELLSRRHRDAASWSRCHYRYARTLYREIERWMERFNTSSSALMTGIETWRNRLSNSEFSVNRNRVYAKHPQRLEQDESLVWKLFAFVGRHGLDLGGDTVERVRRFLESRPLLAENAASLRDSLWPVLETPHANVAIRAMERTGFLAALFPEWNDIDALLVRDFYHRYTVDEHTLVCIDALCELMRGKPDLDPRLLDLAVQTQSQPLLLLALIFHDIGKKDGVEGHAERSAALAERAMVRIGLSGAETAAVQTLIAQHLLLSHAMRTRDLSDPGTGQEIAAIMDTLPMLRRLALLTYADIRGVFPGALTPWRLDQLWSAYRVAQVALEDRIARERIHPTDGFSPQERQFLAGFSTRYLRIFVPPQIREHYELYLAALAGERALRLRPQERAFELIAVAADHPGLFAEITGVLAGMGQNILLADAFRNEHGYALLRFQFEDPMRSLTLNPSDLELLVKRLDQVLRGGARAADVVPRRGAVRAPRASRTLEPYVYTRNDVSPTLTMVEIGAPDRQGLLYDITRTIASLGCTIDVLIVETRAHRAFDTLYVQKNGTELDDSGQAQLVHALLSVLRAA
jgi:[protein-PII] uridylyltransferase